MNNSAIKKGFIQLLILTFICISLPAYALFISPPKDPIPFIQESFPTLTQISEKQGEPLLWTIYQESEILGYAFETNDLAKIPAYSGEPVNMLVVIDPSGKYLNAKVLEHHEPIILAGIPEKKLWRFIDQYVGLSVSDSIKVGGSASQDYVPIDGLSGATVTVIVMNKSITKAAHKAAVSLRIIEEKTGVIQPISTIKKAFFEKKTWSDLTGDGSIRKLYLTNQAVQNAFVGTEAEEVDKVPESQADSMFAEVYYALADIPSIGKNLFGESDYQWFTQDLKEGEHLIAVFGNGYSYKGSGYVRGGIFDRIQIHQNNNGISFRDLEHTRVADLYTEDAPKFREMSVFKVAAHHEFDPGASWQIELLVRRQTGPVDSLFNSFKGSYDVL
ncbi:MAG TPA: FMN-binding protein, partial [Psychromonas sp.]